jgi:hypothetical protein
MYSTFNEETPSFIQDSFPNKLSSCLPTLALGGVAAEMEMFHLFEAFLSTIVDYVERAKHRPDDTTIPSLLPPQFCPGIPSEDLTVWFFYFGHDVGDDNGEITWAFHSSRYLIFFVSPSSQRKVMVSMLKLWFAIVLLHLVHRDKLCSPHSRLF